MLNLLLVALKIKSKTLYILHILLSKNIEN